MVRTAIQLFTLRDLEEPIWKTVERVGATDFDGVELYDAHFDVFGDEVARERTADGHSSRGRLLSSRRRRQRYRRRRRLRERRRGSGR